jgi:hypothetical protein
MSESLNFHEQFRQEAPAKSPSIRAFGYVLAALFAIIGFGPLLKTGEIRPWALIVSLAFIVVTLLLPRILAPLLWVWTRIGLLLHKIMNPVFLGLIFYGAVAPTGLIMRALGKRPLQLNFEPAARSYWIDREPPGPPPQTMKKQF